MPAGCCDAVLNQTAATDVAVLLTQVDSAFAGGVPEWSASPLIPEG